jgi:hypothetical protein
MRQTYAVDAGGPQLSEYRTTLQAQQAYNRRQLNLANVAARGLPEGDLPDQRGPALQEAARLYGGYEPPAGPTNRQLAALDQKSPEKKAIAEEVTAGAFNKLLKERLVKEYGVDTIVNGVNTRILPPEIDRLGLGHRPTSAEHVDEILKTIKPEAETGKHLDLFNNPATRDTARVQMLNGYRADRKAQGLPMDPATETFIKTAPATRENVQWFQQNYKPTGAPGGATPGVAPAAGNLPAATSYEQLTPAQGQRVRKLRQAAEAEEDAKRNLATTDVIPHVTPEEFQADLRKKEAQREQEARKRDLRFLGQLNQPRL